LTGIPAFAQRCTTETGWLRNSAIFYQPFKGCGGALGRGIDFGLGFEFGFFGDLAGFAIRRAQPMNTN
jgi:hypothetical protein